MATTIDELMTRRPRLEFAVELTPARIDEFWKRGFTSIQRSGHARRAYSNEWQIEPVRRESPAARPWFDEDGNAATSAAR